MVYMAVIIVLTVIIYLAYFPADHANRHVKWMMVLYSTNISLKLHETMS
jgi:hypothetical protein